jgi:hypothetical protein
VIDRWLEKHDVVLALALLPLAASLGAMFRW